MLTNSLTIFDEAGNPIPKPVGAQEDVAMSETNESKLSHNGAKLPTMVLKMPPPLMSNFTSVNPGPTQKQ